jgi:crossover junction endodeoxyribonuclease RusA
MSTELTFTIPPDLWLSANQRLHWAPKAKRTQALREMAYLHVQGVVEPQDVTHVAAFIGYPRNGKADPANAAPTVKALIDGMTDAGVWPDDDSTHVIGPTFLRDPKSPTPGHYAVRLVLTAQDIPWLNDKETP